MGELAGIIERRFGTRSRSSKADWLNPIELLMGSCVSHLLSPSFFYPHISIRWWSEDFVFKLRQFKSQNKGIMQAGSISSLASRSQPIASTHMPRSHMHKATSDSIQPDPVPPPAKSKSLQSLTQILPRVSIPTMPISLNRTQSPLYTVKNPIKVSDVSRVLLEICESLARIGTKLKDNGKLNKNMSEIYENFASRKEDIKIYTKTSPASVSSSLQTLTESSAAFVNPDPRLSSIQCSLHNLYMAAFTLSQLLSPISPSSLKVENKYSWITMGFKRVRLFEVYADVERAWHTLIMHLTLTIARESSGTAQSMTKNLHKLAVATGAPDWNDLTLDDGRLLYARGEKYVLGLGVAKSNDLAFKAYTTSAQCDNPAAMNMLGVMCETGMGREMDMVTAIKWYTQAAQKHCAEALNNLARIYESGKSVQRDSSLAYTFYLRAAELGNPEAMTSLGFMLENGVGKEKDEELALQWYKVAAAAGYARGMNSLGGCYYRGVGVERDYGEAVIWYRKAAEQGNASAQNNLGICYEEGKGVMKDLVLAKTWYKAASDAKHANATNNLGFMHLLEKNWTEALKLFYLAWALGSADAAFNIGTLYENGCEDMDGPVVEQNIELALRWFKEASEKDSTKGQIRLATLLTTLPAPRLHDAEIAIAHLQRAVDTGSAEAMTLMGQMLQLGIGATDSEPDLIGAFELFSRASLQGDASAMFNLGNCFETGAGVERDHERAYMLFEEAARLGSVEAEARVGLRNHIAGYAESFRGSDAHSISKRSRVATNT